MAYNTNHKKKILDFLIANEAHHFTIEEIIEALATADRAEKLRSAGTEI